MRIHFNLSLGKKGLREVRHYHKEQIKFIWSTTTHTEWNCHHQSSSDKRLDGRRIMFLPHFAVCTWQFHVPTYQLVPPPSVQGHDTTSASVPPLLTQSLHRLSPLHSHVFNESLLPTAFFLLLYQHWYPPTALDAAILIFNGNGFHYK